VKRRRAEQRRREQQELDITAFLNLMVILVPFLLITAVFSRLAILELDVPTAAGGEAPAEPTLQLEVVVRADEIEIGARDGGLFTTLPRDETAGHDYAALTAWLARVKADEPEQTRATVLLEPDIAYDVLVQVMDAVRLHEVVDADTGLVERAELFPDIAVGDAPPRTREG
jgi:biopolymer transport protein ExbD